MKGHTCAGALIFNEPESALEEMCRDVALRHHEWWDGQDKGYPGDLKGEEIPLSARIVSIADVFDALSHKRAYKSAWSLEDSFFEIEKLSGTQFDPKLVKAFLQIKDRIIAINSAFEANGSVEDID